MSASVTLLAWGLLEYEDAYEAAGQLEYMYDCIRWPLEWLLKAHTAPNELYIQVTCIKSIMSPLNHFSVCIVLCPNNIQKCTTSI